MADSGAPATKRRLESSAAASDSDRSKHTNKQRGGRAAEEARNSDSAQRKPGATGQAHGHQAHVNNGAAPQQNDQAGTANTSKKPRRTESVAAGNGQAEQGDEDGDVDMDAGRSGRDTSGAHNPFARSWSAGDRLDIDVFISCITSNQDGSIIVGLTRANETLQQDRQAAVDADKLARAESKDAATDVIDADAQEAMVVDAANAASMFGPVLAPPRRVVVGGLLGQYLQLSPECAELFGLWEKDRSQKLLVPLLFLLTNIIKFAPEATSLVICRKILRIKTKLVYAHLSSEHFGLVATTLELLAAVCLHSVAVAREFLQRFQFGSNVFQHIARGQFTTRANNPRLLRNIRHGMLRLVTALLTCTAVDVQRDVLTTRGIVQSLVHHLDKSAPPIVLRFLRALHHRAAHNPRLSIRLRRDVLNPNCLTALLALYQADASLRQVVHAFFVSLCDAADRHEEGALFDVSRVQYEFDPSAAEKNQPAVIRQLLRLALGLRAAEDALQQELALRLVTSVPPLVSLILVNLPYALEPRHSPQWVANVTFVSKLLLLPVPPIVGMQSILTQLKAHLATRAGTAAGAASSATALVEASPVMPAADWLGLIQFSGIGAPASSAAQQPSGDVTSVTSLIATLVNANIPSGANKSLLTRGILHPHELVVQSTLNLVIAILTRIRMLSTALVSAGCARAVPLLRSFAAQQVPEVQTLLSLRTRMSRVLSGELANPADVPDDDARHQPSREAAAVVYARLIACFRMYFNTLPNTVMSAGFDWVKLFPAQPAAAAAPSHLSVWSSHVPAVQVQLLQLLTLVAARVRLNWMQAPKSDVPGAQSLFRGVLRLFAFTDRPPVRAAAKHVLLRAMKHDAPTVESTDDTIDYEAQDHVEAAADAAHPLSAWLDCLIGAPALAALTAMRHFFPDDIAPDPCLMCDALETAVGASLASRRPIVQCIATVIAHAPAPQASVLSTYVGAVVHAAADLPHGRIELPDSLLSDPICSAAVAYSKPGSRPNAPPAPVDTSVVDAITHTLIHAIGEGEPTLITDPTRRRRVAVRLTRKLLFPPVSASDMSTVLPSVAVFCSSVLGEFDPLLAWCLAGTDRNLFQLPSVIDALSAVSDKYMSSHPHIFQAHPAIAAWLKKHKADYREAVVTLVHHLPARALLAHAARLDDAADPIWMAPSTPFQTVVQQAVQTVDAALLATLIAPYLTALAAQTRPEVVPAITTLHSLLMAKAQSVTPAVWLSCVNTCVADAHQAALVQACQRTTPPALAFAACVSEWLTTNREASTTYAGMPIHALVSSATAAIAQLGAGFDATAQPPTAIIVGAATAVGFPQTTVAPAIAGLTTAQACATPGWHADLLAKLLRHCQPQLLGQQYAHAMQLVHVCFAAGTSEWEAAALALFDALLSLQGVSAVDAAGCAETSALLQLLLSGRMSAARSQVLYDLAVLSCDFATQIAAEGLKSLSATSWSGKNANATFQNVKKALTEHSGELFRAICLLPSVALAPEAEAVQSAFRELAIWIGLVPDAPQLVLTGASLLLPKASASSASAAVLWWFKHHRTNEASVPWTDTSVRVVQCALQTPGRSICAGVVAALFEFLGSCESVPDSLITVVKALPAQIELPGDDAEIQHCMEHLTGLAVTQPPAAQVLERLISIVGIGRHTQAAAGEAQAGPLDPRRLTLCLAMHADFLIEDPHASRPGHSQRLLSILCKLITADTRVCTQALLLSLLCRYDASLSPQDRTLRQIFSVFESAGVQLSAVGFVWGMAAAPFVPWDALDAPALVIQDATTAAGATSWLFDSLAADQFPVGGVALDRMQASCSHFPVSRGLGEAGDAFRESALPSSVLHAVYDPAFVLPILAAALEFPDMPLRKFIETGSLGYSLMALASDQEDVRKLAYGIVAQSLTLLSSEETASFRERPQVLLLLQCVKGAVTTAFAQLPALQMYFAAQASLILLNPGNEFYQPLNGFLLQRPALDFGLVPMFKMVFLKGNDHHISGTKWMLHLLARGLQDRQAHHLLVKRAVYQRLMGLFSSLQASEEMQECIIDLLLRACKLQTLQPKNSSAVDDEDAQPASESKGTDAVDGHEAGDHDMEPTTAGDDDVVDSTGVTGYWPAIYLWRKLGCLQFLVDAFGTALSSLSHNTAQRAIECLSALWTAISWYVQLQEERDSQRTSDQTRATRQLRRTVVACDFSAAVRAVLCQLLPALGRDTLHPVAASALQWAASVQEWCAAHASGSVVAPVDTALALKLLTGSSNSAIPGTLRLALVASKTSHTVGQLELLQRLMRAAIGATQEQDAAVVMQLGAWLTAVVQDKPAVVSVCVSQCEWCGSAHGATVHTQMAAHDKSVLRVFAAALGGLDRATIAPSVLHAWQRVVAAVVAPMLQVAGESTPKVQWSGELVTVGAAASSSSSQLAIRRTLTAVVHGEPCLDLSSTNVVVSPQPSPSKPVVASAAHFMAKRKSDRKDASARKHRRSDDK